MLSVTSKCFLWKIGVGVLSALLQRLKGWEVSLLVLRPYTALCIKLVCMAVTPGRSLFWRRYTRKPANSLLKTYQQSTWITGTMSYGLMRWRLICLVSMASSMCGGDQMRSTKISVSCLQQAWWWECHGLGLHECCRCWRVTFHWGKHELQHVLLNTVTEHYPLLPETVLQGNVPAWQWPQTHLQDNPTALLKRLRVKVIDWPIMYPDLHPIEHLWRILKRKVEVRKVSNIRQLCDVVTEEWKSIPVATCEALVKSVPRRVKAVLDNDGGHQKYWQLTWCMLILTNFPKGCNHFCWQGLSF